MITYQARRTKQSGFTLPELLISLVLGLTLVGAVMTAYLTALKSSGDNNEQAQLTHNLRASLDLILSDLKRAGGTASDDLDSSPLIIQKLPLSMAKMGKMYGQDNDFTNTDNGNLKLWSCSAASECPCVTYSYDLDRDGDLYTGKMNHFGFKLSGTRLQIRTGSTVAPGVAHPGCGYDKPDNTWESLTEDDIQITQFSVSYIDGDGNIIAAPEEINVPGGGRLQERNLQVTISGTKDEFSLTVTGKVRVRNDRYIP